MSGKTVDAKKTKKATKSSVFMTHEKAMARQDNQLASMHPAFAARVKSLLAHLDGRGWQAFVFQGKTRSEAQAKKNQEKGTGITMSWHRPEVHGRLRDQIVELYAADIVDERWGWEGPAKDTKHPFWKDLGEHAKAEGLEWGGDWKDKNGKAKPDVAHVQMMLMDMAPTNSRFV